jgi:hypothetical protein
MTCKSLIAFPFRIQVKHRVVSLQLSLLVSDSVFIYKNNFKAVLGVIQISVWYLIKEKS